MQLADRYFEGKKADRILIYNPDAIAYGFSKVHILFSGVFKHTQIGLPMRA